jgi:hypothetical protein
VPSEIPQPVDQRLQIAPGLLAAGASRFFRGMACFMFDPTLETIATTACTDPRLARAPL